MKEVAMKKKQLYIAPVIVLHDLRTTGLLAASPRTLNFVGDVDNEDDVL